MLKSELAALAKKAGIDVGSLTKDQIVARLTGALRSVGVRAGLREPGKKAADKPRAEKPPATRPTAEKPPATRPTAEKARETKARAGTAERRIERSPAAARRPAAASAPPSLKGQSRQPEDSREPSDQTQATRSKYEVGEARAHELVDLDHGRPALPEGYADNRVVLLPRDPDWLYAYWDITNEHKDAARRRGGRALALRLYDVTDIVFDGSNAHGMWEQEAHELARNWYLHVPTAGRHYCLEVGYRGAHGEWLLLGRSNPVVVPTDRPSTRLKDVFVTIPFDRPLPGLGASAPAPGAPLPRPDLHEVLFQAAGGPAAGVGSSLGMSAALGREVSPWSGGWSGLISSAGLPASPRPEAEKGRQFWFRVDAELIVYGATEPSATVMSGGRQIPLRPDGTFYLRMHFPDGVHDFPLEATAADGEQKRAIHLNFKRHTD